ncbi:hypothetical protein Isova_0768 [Isoptericola variabilis 225]|uniref:DUF3017 domain-containing protein n=1 Tax=Isoptericola variabilis (strain 225) TaxID=743718 RepID=F6FWY2_ISOV2|nr:hypothetical protein Isova_0768 [Isoptericola variabilis 225]
MTPPRPAWDAVVPAPPAERPARPSPVRAILLATAGILLAVVLGVTLSARAGALAVAATLAVAGTWRAVAPDGPPGLVVRSRGFDVLLCWGSAAMITFLAFTAPGVG